jgi:hypothetical protein
MYRVCGGLARGGEGVLRLPEGVQVRVRAVERAPIHGEAADCGGRDFPGYRSLFFEWLGERKIFVFRIYCVDFRASETRSSSTMGGMVENLFRKRFLGGARKSRNSYIVVTWANERHVSHERQPC